MKLALNERVEEVGVLTCYHLGTEHQLYRKEKSTEGELSLLFFVTQFTIFCNNLEYMVRSDGSIGVTLEVEWGYKGQGRK